MSSAKCPWCGNLQKDLEELAPEHCGLESWGDDTQVCGSCERPVVVHCDVSVEYSIKKRAMVRSLGVSPDGSVVLEAKTEYGLFSVKFLGIGTDAVGISSQQFSPGIPLSALSAMAEYAGTLCPGDAPEEWPS